LALREDFLRGEEGVQRHGIRGHAQILRGEEEFTVKTCVRIDVVGGY
jgi:hypothetical protein